MKIYKIGSTVVPRYFIAGYPVGLCQDSWCSVAEVRKQRGLSTRYKITSARGSSYWVSHEDIRSLGETDVR
jgi:hypothetical protein